MLVALFASFVVLAACSTTDSGGRAGSSGSSARIVLHTDDVVGPFDQRLLGTNVPAWLSPDVVASDQFRALAVASGTTLLRLPGGSASTNYRWLDCEMGSAKDCGLKPSNYLGLLQATGLPAMWTVSINGTPQEAAALVAFFNGAVDDPRPIGTDRAGRDWQTVGHWAQLRAERGYPAPVPVRYWEVGNEVYAAKNNASAGSNCADIGWEDVWTCDGTEYVNGNDQHDGYLAFHDAMHAVDADIQVGAVGAGARGEWNNWDDAVMEAAGGDIDFYVVHNYDSNGDVAAADVFGKPGKTWPRLTGDLRDGFADHGVGDVPIAVTEHNLVAFQDGDDEKLMTMAVNAFYLAETIGQMAANGVSIANQWNLDNGALPDNGTDYGLIHPDLQRSPAYYAMVLWSRFGDQLVRAEAGRGLGQLSLYAGRGPDGSARLLVINPTAASIGTRVAVEPVAAGAVTADVVKADSLQSTDVTFNGSANPSIGLTEPGEVLMLTGDGELQHEFPAYSITLLSWSAQS